MAICLVLFGAPLNILLIIKVKIIVLRVALHCGGGQSRILAQRHGYVGQGMVCQRR